MRTQSLSPIQLAGIAEQITRILSPRQLTEILGLSPATLWRMRQRGELPKPIRLSPGRVGWRADTIDRWLTERTETSS